jgi:NADPH:quinone reductase-like Zn-dependent oxidoreductase
VVALGAGVGVFALGDAVYGATNDQFVGGYAEYALVEADKVAPKPAALDYVTAAGLPVIAVTAWQMLFEYARIEPGQAILVRGAAACSPIGSLQPDTRLLAVIFSVKLCSTIPLTY